MTKEKSAKVRRFTLNTSKNPNLNSFSKIQFQLSNIQSPKWQGIRNFIRTYLAENPECDFPKITPISSN